MKGNLWVIAAAALIGIIAAEQETFYYLFILLFVLIWCARKAPRLIIYVVLTFVIFHLYMNIVDTKYRTSLSGEEKVIKGAIVSLPILDGDRLSFELRTSSNEKVLVNYYLASKKEKHSFETLSVGSICELTGVLKPPPTPGIPKQFNYRTYLKHKNIFWIQALNKSPHCIPSANSLSIKIHQIRQNVLHDIETFYPNELKGIAASLLIGDKSQLTSEVAEAYQDLGLSHVLAVSGLHVGVIGGILFWLLIRSGVTRQRAFEILFFFYPFYIVLAGGAPSVIRASVMAMAVLVSLRFRYKPNPLDAISVACILILFYKPNYVYHVGFQLSFIISFALIISSSTLLKMYNSLFSQVFAVSLLAQIVSLPLVIYHFYEISLFSLPLNIIYVPVVSIIVLPSILLLAFLRLIPIPYFFQIASTILSFIVKIFHDLFVWVNEFNMSLIYGSPSYLIIVSMLLVSFFVLLLWESKQFLKGLSLWLVTSLIVYLLPYANPYGEVTFLDVGQGDCIIIKLPFQKQVMVIDTGGIPMFGEEEEWQKKRGVFDTGEDLIVPYLKSKGIRSIDYLLLTHGDYDHVGGAKGILKEMNVKTILMDRSKEQTKVEKEFSDIARSKGTKVYRAKEGVSWKSGDAIFSILQVMQTDEENDGSIVMLLELGGYRWLLTGDIEEEGEAHLLKTSAEIKAEILKVGHHGSNTSSSQQLIEAVDPEIAIISSGENNRYGHPDPIVVERLEKSGTKVLRTDINGSISYTFRANKSGKWNVVRNEK